jgi:uncharacterized repeat protein (TIGR03803 family)
LVQAVPAVEAAKFRKDVLHSACSLRNCKDGANRDSGMIEGDHIPNGAARVATESVLHSFGASGDGQSPEAALIHVGGTLYGTTVDGGAYGDGTVFALGPGNSDRVLYSFCSQPACADGANPYASLINVAGTFYGTTEYGGVSGQGTVFSIDPNTGSETVLYSFCAQQNCADGANPFASLIEVNGVLYGTAGGGGGTDCGGSGCGTVFSLDPDTGSETVLHSFCSLQNCADGQYPEAGLINVNGTLYGTTVYGGTNLFGEGGTVFALDPSTGAENVVYNFCGLKNCADGQYADAGLVDVNGILYSTTFTGGTHHEGTVFALDLGTGAETVLHSFCSQRNCTDGSSPLAGLNEFGGMLYGTTFGGGTLYNTTKGDVVIGQICGGGCGTVFSVNPDTGAETVLYSFCSRQNCTDGAFPEAGLIDLAGTLYGVTLSGGTGPCINGCGTVFALQN